MNWLSCLTSWLSSLLILWVSSLVSLLYVNLKLHGFLLVIFETWKFCNVESLFCVLVSSDRFLSMTRIFIFRFTALLEPGNRFRRQCLSRKSRRRRRRGRRVWSADPIAGGDRDDPFSAARIRQSLRFDVEPTYADACTQRRALQPSEWQRRGLALLFACWIFKTWTELELEFGCCDDWVSFVLPLWPL